MVAIQPSSNVEKASIVCPVPQTPMSLSQANRVNQLVILDETSILKGIFWGRLGLQFGSATMIGTGATVAGGIVTMTSILENAARFNRFKDHTETAVCVLGTISAGLLTYALGSITWKCVSNCLYHFGPRQVRVIQLSN